MCLTFRGKKDLHKEYKSDKTVRKFKRKNNNYRRKYTAK